jgi:protein-L-isoaspartate(D-aspartate) O-methyltransferase
VTEQCPECGFDLEPGAACQVCGYGPGSSPAKKRESPRRSSTRGSLGILLASTGGLLVALAIFMLLDMRGQGVETEPGPPVSLPAADQAVPAPVPAPPAPAPAEPAPALAPPARAPDPVPSPSVAPVKEKPRAQRAQGPIVLSSVNQGYDITSREDDPPVTDISSFTSWMLSHMDQKQKFLVQKWERAQVLLRTKNITHQRILEAFLRTPREFFCRDSRRAYESAVLPIGFGQTISGPHMVARMTDFLDPQPEQKVLEIGTGSGYQSAVLSELSNHVFTIEIVETLARETDAIYRRHEERYPEYLNIHRKIDDGYYGWADHAPFDRIIVTCGIDHVPPELLNQLAPDGIMVIPVGPPSGQTILRITKHVGADGAVTLLREDIFQGRRKEVFVPFTSRAGGVHRAGDGGDQR